jgi:GT2 family glycosyltransferase
MVGIFMKVLVGVPVFRVPDLVEKCIISLTEQPADVLVIDNASDWEVKQVIKRHANKIQVIVSDTNTFCNGGWNLILEYGISHGFDIIGLGSSDAVLKYGWQDAVRNRANKASNEVWIASQVPSNEEVTKVESVAGFFSFLPLAAAKLVYPIPNTIRHWFGDQYMFEKLRANGWNTVILNTLQAVHQQSAITYVTPEAYTVIEQDKLAWKELRW